VLKGVPGQCQQAGITTLGGRMAGNQPIRENKIKIVDVHVLYRHGSYKGRQGYLLCHEEKTVTRLSIAAGTCLQANRDTGSAASSLLQAGSSQVFFGFLGNSTVAVADRRSCRV